MESVARGSAPGQPFPAGFVWGAATSAFQIEGAAAMDGRAPSIWDTFCKRPGAVYLGHTGQCACDHYHRVAEDVSLMSRIGLKAYRFSISWPRVVPDPSARPNAAALAFYDRLVDSLLAAGIEPHATLFHWDLPQWAEDRGGWLDRQTADRLSEFAQVMSQHLSDRVRSWATVNEPQCFIKFGYGDGTNAPGHKLPFRDQVRAAHVALLAHGKAAQAIRASAKRPLRVGWAPIGRTDFPATGSEADIRAARDSMMSITEQSLWNNTWFADPVCLGRYPEDGLRAFGDDGPRINDGDMEIIHQPLDFYGLNIYDGRCVRASTSGSPEVVPFAPGHPQTAFRWFITPEALRWGPRFIYERYRAPIYITENGMSSTDWVHSDGRVHDPQRIDYTRRYLAQLRLAIADGADIRGYFHWSLLDNFEWAQGYKERFGLVHVDFATGARTLKDSAAWYSRVIREHGAGAALEASPATTGA